MSYIDEILWSEFTLINYINLKNLYKKYIDENSIYFTNVINILEEVKQISHINYEINKHLINKQLLLRYCSVFWVYNGILSCIDELNEEHLISWNNNKIFIKCTTDKFNKFKKRLPYLLKMIEHIKKDSNKNITIYLLLSKLKKTHDNSNEIKPKHINSGYTDTVAKYIFIWREEEFEKVLFHELIHFFDHDHRDEVYTYYNNFESLYEAITDLKGITYNLIYLSFITNKSLLKLFNYEFSFINNQGIMINNLINKNVKLISPAFSYFVLKAMLINYISSSEFTVKEYNDIFILNQNFNNIINKLNKIINTNYHNFNSCRMTFFELE
jgi:hypothetical protein